MALSKYERYTAIKTELDKAFAALDRLRVLDDPEDETLDPITGPAKLAREQIEGSRERMRVEMARFFRKQPPKKL